LGDENLKYGELVRRQKADEKRGMMPAGFDISLANVMTEYNLDDKQIRQLGELTATRQIASATVGHNVFYRKATIERLFVDAK
jgi:hypothetical protein